MDKNKTIDIENDYNNECDICCHNHDNESIILKCNHKFHYYCILMSFITSQDRKCPYCRLESDLLEYREKYGYRIFNIHYK